MAKRKMLLIVEGEKQEVALFRAMFASYELDYDYEIFPYRTNIYELYERMFADAEEDDLSLLGVLKERARADEAWLFDQDYSDILLVFDYEPQDNRFSPERLKRMQAYFDESTDNGKLYVNYPMVEACKHFDQLPDYGYLSRTVSLEEVCGYKQIVGLGSRFQNFNRDFDKEAFDQAILTVASKAMRAVGLDCCGELDRDYGQLSFLAILDAQNRMLEERREIYVLGLALLFVLDYSPSLVDASNWEKLLAA